MRAATGQALFWIGTIEPQNSIHDIDVMLWYTGERVVRVRGFGRKATGRSHHDTFWGVLEFERGTLGRC